MAPVKPTSRALRFAVGGALLTAPLLGGCDNKKAEEPNVNEGPAPEGAADEGKKPEGGEKPEKPSADGPEKPDGPAPDEEPPHVNEGPEPEGLPHVNPAAPGE